jgi:DNA-binding response OmpR family regulator
MAGPEAEGERVQMNAYAESVAARSALIVESDLLFSVRLERALAAAGFEPHVVGQIEEGVRACAYAPALAIVNCGSPRLPGAEAVRALRAALPDLPILGYMPHTRMPELKAAAREAGCDLVVANSAVAQRLPRILERLLASRYDREAMERLESEEEAED